MNLAKENGWAKVEREEVKLKGGNEKLQFVVAQISHFLHVSRNGSTVSLSETLPDFCCGEYRPRRVLSWRERKRRRSEETGEETGKRKTKGENMERNGGGMKGVRGSGRGGGGKGGGREEKGDMSKIIREDRGFEEYAHQW